MSDRQRLEELFAAHFADVLAHAIRRCASRQDAKEVAAETFLVAGRRIGELPEEPEARLWLFGTARLVTLNHRRSRGRQRGLVERISRRGQPVLPAGVDVEVGERQRLSAALETLNVTDREILRLHAWEQLDTQEIATTLELAPAAVRKRLQRARERLATALGECLDDSAETPSVVSMMTPTVRRAAP